MRIVKTKEHSVIQKHVQDYISLLRNKIEENRRELMTQALTCPSTLTPSEIYDKRLKEFVRLHHIDLMRTINYQITKLQDSIYEKTLFHQLCSYYHLNNTQVFKILKLTYLHIFFSSSLCRVKQSIE